MRNVSNAFKQALEDGNRNYQCTAEIILTDNTQVTLTNANLLINGLSIKDNASDDGDFTALGSVIVNAVEIRANNLSGTYSDYDFRDGIITIYVGLIVGTTVESIKIGTYIINEASIQKSVLSLYCLDYLSKFDKPYSNSTLVYPATLASILSNACIDCGVVLASTTFPNSTLTIATAPQTDLTYREVVSFIATIAGCFTKCNANGQLVLQWFDSNAEHDLTALSSYDYSVSDITITGIKIITQTISESETTEVEHLFGTDDYIITIENNPFITESNVTTIGNYLVSQIAGLTFRIANISHLSDPTIEAGDVAVVTDRHGNTYNILVTSTTFNVSSYQETKCSAVEPVEKTVTRFTETQKTYATAKQLIKQEKTARQQMGQDLTNAINAKAGMYETRVQESGGGYTYYLHDKPLLANSTAVIKVTNEAVAVTPDYQAATPTWYGLTVNGNFIANIMSTIGINFDWGTGGTLTLGGANNGNGVLTILDANNESIGTWNNTGISLTKGSLRSSDYVYGTGPYYCQSGMIINLNSKVIMTPKFSVIDGVLRATDGIFSGTITSESGKIGNWTISNYQISQTTDIDTSDTDPQTQYMAFMRSRDGGGTTPATGDTYAFGALQRSYEDGSYGNWSSNFYVKYDGYLFSRIGKIGPWNIAETSIYKGGGYQSSTAGSAYFGDSGFSITDKFYITNTGEAHVLGAGLYISDDVSDYGRIQFSQGAIASDVIGFMISTARNLYIGAGLGYDGYGNISIDGFGKIHLLGCAGVRIRAIKNNNYTNIEFEGNVVVKNNNLSLMKESYERGVAPSSPIYSAYAFTDVNGDTIGFLRSVVATNGNHSLQLVLSTPTAAGGDTAALSLTKNASEVVTCRIAGATTVEGDITAEVSTASACAVHAKNSLVEARLIAAASGNVGVYNATNSKWLIYMNTDSDPKPIIPQLATVTTTSAGNVYANSSGALYRNTSSSKRYKHDIKLLDDWKAILNIPVVSFIYNDGYLSKEDQRYGIAVPGFIAEDVYKYYSIAAERCDNEIEDWNTRFIIPPMLAVEQDHEKRIKELENEVYELKQLIAKLI